MGKDYDYHGDFFEDKKHGNGKMYYPNSNETYEGNFKNNTLTGKGKYTWGNGDSYSGDFLNGKMHGVGEYLWKEGGKYIGEYTDNIKVGRGVFYWTNGRIYEGEFSNGKPHGTGIISQDKKRYETVFNDGKLVSRKLITAQIANNENNDKNKNNNF